MTTTERIEQAAIKMGSASWVGKRHSDCIKAMTDCGFKVGNWPQGFMTTHGRFVDRKEALKIAIAAGQVKNSKHNILFSEDLY
jgi:hypothetical protein